MWVHRLEACATFSVKHTGNREICDPVDARGELAGAGVIDSVETRGASYSDEGHQERA